MFRYRFWEGSIEGLNEEIELLADNYQDAVVAAKKHMDRQLSKPVAANAETVEVNIACVGCGQVFHGWEHIDCVGHKEATVEELVQDALMRDNEYKKFQKLHSHHSFQEGGWLVADGTRRVGK